MYRDSGKKNSSLESRILHLICLSHMFTEIILHMVFYISFLPNSRCVVFSLGVRSFHLELACTWSQR
jgi:hypothetical protein